MLLFEGDDAYGWVYRVERFFNIRGLVTTGERLRAACLEGPALAWFCWSKSRQQFCHWEELKSRLLYRFQRSHEGSLHEQLEIKGQPRICEFVQKDGGTASGVTETKFGGNLRQGPKARHTHCCQEAAA